ncbi:MAG: NAD(P)H-dependent oxidoreductase [Bacteroidales bacterium]|nr:NAD(P)H-dependent oxidoreductase [Bacteroidales bacterium]
MKKTLVIASHTYFEQSTATATILSKLAETSNVTVRNLDAIYSDYNIDASAEQQLLLDSDVVVFQFPMFWYSVPSLMKRWFDEVYAYGFAFGSTGDKLKGKKVILSVTTGGPEEGYSSDGYNGHSIYDFLLPLRQTMNLAQMEYAGLHISYSMNPMMEGKEEVLAKAEAHATNLITALQAI